MLNKEKSAKLKDIGYAIYPCCGICKRGNFINNMALWGHCDLHFYRIGNAARPLGIHRLGRCNRGFVLDETAATTWFRSYLGLYREADDFEDLLSSASAFHIDLTYHHDEDCPENCCWKATSPFLPPEFNGAQMGRTEALRAAIEFILTRFEEKK